VVVVAGVVVGSLGPACIAVNALVVDEEFPGRVIRPFFASVCHSRGQKYSKWTGKSTDGIALGKACLLPKPGLRPLQC
jgi:hypothetical protein